MQISYSPVSLVQFNNIELDCVAGSDGRVGGQYGMESNYSVDKAKDYLVNNIQPVMCRLQPRC